MKRTVCVVGLGRIGLPFACLLAHTGFKVYGVDINQKHLSEIRKGQAFIEERNLQGLLVKVLNDQSLSLIDSPISSDVFVIAVPTPLGVNRSANLADLNQAIEGIKPLLQPGNLILIESTCPIGTTDRIAESLRTSCKDVHVAYSPERVLPGNILEELVDNDRVVGGADPYSTELGISFYESFVRGRVHPTDSRTAEAVKLAENAFRDVNIAFANELSMIADKVKIDVNQLILLANRHPRVNILQPGPGVGGHCLAIDPWFLAAAAPGQSSLICQARQVNMNKACWVEQKILEQVRCIGAQSVACFGLTYKPDVSDLRESPSMKIADALQKYVKVYRVDPYVSGSESLDIAIEMADIIVGLVAHRDFASIPRDRLKSKMVLDFAGVFR